MYRVVNVNKIPSNLTREGCQLASIESSPPSIDRPTTEQSTRDRGVPNQPSNQSSIKQRLPSSRQMAYLLMTDRTTADR